MAISFISQGATKTSRLGFALGKELLGVKLGKQALVVALKGDLGSGKTTFVQGLAKGFGVKSRIASPTFLLARSYPIRDNRALYHIDCYRLSSSKDLISLGWNDWVRQPNNIIVVEWADKISRLLPNDAMHISFVHGEKSNERIINWQVKR